MRVPHRQATHAITRNERSHAIDSHAKQVYIIQIYTQANPRRIYGNDSMLNNTHDNIQLRIKHVKMNEINNNKNVHVKVSRVIIQQGKSIYEDKRKDQSI